MQRWWCLFVFLAQDKRLKELQDLGEVSFKNAKEILKTTPQDDVLKEPGSQTSLTLITEANMHSSYYMCY